MQTLCTMPSVGIVCAVSCEETLSRYLLRSPCLNTQNIPCLIRRNAKSAAEAFNSAREEMPCIDWWIWVHQDVLLPDNWLAIFQTRLQEALKRWPNLAVVGAYGVTKDGQHAGNVLDRGKHLKGSVDLPVRVQSLDELLIAVKSNSQLCMDKALGFDFYGTDLALQAETRGFAAAAMDIYCEHWSTTPSQPPYDPNFLARLTCSATILEKKWQNHLPIITPCLPLTHIGSAATQLQYING